MQKFPQHGHLLLDHLLAGVAVDDHRVIQQELAALGIVTPNAFASREGRGDAGLKLLAITVLTSLDQQDLAADGYQGALAGLVSLRVANARIAYAGQGALADANNPGWLMRFFTGPLMPF